MKKAFGIVAIVLSMTILVTVLFTNGFKEPIIGDNEKSIKALKLYAETIEKAKNEDDFSLELTTSIKLNEIECANPLFNSVLRRIISYRIGNIDKEIETFTFKNGVSLQDETITPFNTVQPVNAQIKEDFFDGVKSSYIYEDQDGECVYFVIGKEKSNINDVLAAYQQCGEYDAHKSYPQIDILAKTHSNFINVMSVVPRVQNLFAKNNDGDMEDYKLLFPNNTNAGETTEIEDGYCFLGDTRVTAINDKDGRLYDLLINAPVGVEVKVRFLGSEIKTMVSFEISQHYVFEYFD